MGVVQDRAFPPEASMDLKGTTPAAATPRGWQMALSPLLLSHALAALLVLGIAAYVMQVSHDTFARQAEVMAQTRAADLRQEVTADLQRIDLAMRHVALANLRETSDPEAKRRLIDESLAEHMVLVPEVYHLRQTDAEGTVRFHGAEWQKDGDSLAQDPVFLQARRQRSAALLLGEPRFDETSGQWTLAVARRVEDHAGNFQGIVIGDLDLTHFDQLIDRHPLSPTDSLSLRNHHLALLSRQTGRDGEAQPLGTTRIVPAFAAALKAHPEAGFFTGRNVIDGVERINAYAMATPYPLMAIAGLSRDEVMVPWRAQAWRIGGAALLAALGVLSSAALTWRAHRLQRDSLRRMDEASRLTRVLLAAAADGVHVLDREGRVVEMSDSFAQMLGWRREDLLGRHVSTWDRGDTPEALTARIRSYRIGERQSFETEHLRADGQTIHVEISCVALSLDGRELLYCASRDMTRRQQLEAEQTAMLDNEVVGIVKMQGRRLVWANRAVYRMFGLPDDADLTLLAPQLAPADLDLSTRLAARHDDLVAGRPVRVQLCMQRLDRSTIWVDVNGALLSDERQETLWVLADITALKRYQEEIEHLAMHDALTGLPNRRLLEDRLAQGMAISRRDGQLLAVCYIDLDGFKGVNDRLGHAAGDLLLQDAAQRISECVREHDTVCRIGGDEFVVLLPLLTQDDEAVHVVQRVLQSLRRPYSLGKSPAVHISASAGLALYPADARDGDSLLRLADVALYQAKAAGRDQMVRWGQPEARLDQPAPAPAPVHNARGGPEQPALT